LFKPITINIHITPDTAIFSAPVNVLIGIVSARAEHQSRTTGKHVRVQVKPHPEKT